MTSPTCSPFCQGQLDLARQRDGALEVAAENSPKMHPLEALAAPTVPRPLPKPSHPFLFFPTSMCQLGPVFSLWKQTHKKDSVPS